MPTICMFFGIKILMNWNDHMPPHFHVEYNENKAIVDIINTKVIKGFLPKRQLRLVLAWAELHKDELMQNWELAREGKELNAIKGLEV
ncbi:MAG: hypothetical protein PWR06_2618 [Thermoanaerobacteraceae bacterium]|nr:hypothetical protein [Clostridiales bacterium]MDK2879902.1 hypothetical protein [Thermoanaerobacteraceae bacterium]